MDEERPRREIISEAPRHENDREPVQVRRLIGMTKKAKLKQIVVCFGGKSPKIMKRHEHDPKIM